MKLRAFIIGALVVVAFTTAAIAQPDPCGNIDSTITQEPVEEDIYYCEFQSWDSITSFIGATFDIVLKAKADATPAAMFDSPVWAAKRLYFRLRPNQGCGVSGCRQGNSYSLKLQVSTADGAKPTCTLCVRVRKKLFTE